MSMFEHLLRADPSSPRLTVYDETAGTRMEFSATTLDNWANKIANMLEEELELSEGSIIAIDLPRCWQAVVIALGAMNAHIDVHWTSAPDGEDAVFTNADRFESWSRETMDVVLVSSDPFGRGIAESGGTLPVGALDFGPTVRFYGDQYFGASPSLSSFVSAPVSDRLLSTGWNDAASFAKTVLAPLAGGGSAVIVAGMTTPARIDDIAATEKVTARL